MKSLILAAAFSVAATAAFAQSTMAPSAAQTQKGQTVSSATQQFVQKAAVTDMFEIKAGDLVQQKAQSNDYKQFGQMIKTDHTKTSDQIKSMSKNLPGLQLPVDLDSAHKAKFDKLQSLSGAQFEDQFKQDVVAGHQDAIKLFENYAQKGDNADLKKFAQDTLPKLKEHLQHAQALPKGAAAQTMGSGAAQPKR
jgi:putative membrane protein